MGNAIATEENEVSFTIERSSVRNEKDFQGIAAQKGKLTAKEEERLNEKREQLRVMREQNKALTLRTRQRLEMSQKLTQEFKARVIITEGDDGHHKGMLRKHARPNLYALSPEKKKEYLSASKIQAIWRGYSVRNTYAKLAKRTVVAKELLETEKDYIHFLTALVTVYYLPLKSKAESDMPLLTLEEVRSMFPQLEMILLYNQQLYDVLDQRIRCKWNADTTIGDTFLALIDFLKPPYTHYISHFPLISQQIKEVSKRLRVSMFFQECKALPECGGLDLAALASMPFQRIPRYILLLKEVVANTGKGHPDYVFLKEAISKMDVLAKTANEKLREQESQRSIMDIARRLDPPIGNLMKPHRKLVREGPMRYKLHHSSSARRLQPGFHNGVIFLFTDCLLVTEPVTISVSKLFDPSTAPKLRPIEVLSLNNSAVLDIMEDYKERNAKCYDFRVHSLQATVIFEVDAMGLKEAWVNDIASAINSLTENAISYKSRTKRKSKAYSSISRRSTSVRIPSHIVAHAIIEEDVRDHPLSGTPPSPVLSRFPYSAADEPPPSSSSTSFLPSTTRPTNVFSPSTPTTTARNAGSPALSAARHSVAHPTQPTAAAARHPAALAHHAHAGASAGAGGSSPSLSPFSSFLSHQRATVNLSAGDLTKEYPINVSQSRALYVDNSPPKIEDFERLKEEKRIEEEKRLAEELRLIDARRKEEETWRNNEEKRKADEKRRAEENKVVKSSSKKYISVLDIVQILSAKDFAEDEEENAEERAEREEREAREAREAREREESNNNNNTTRNRSRSNFDLEGSAGFETYDEMAIRITDSLNQREHFGITRTNSDSNIIQTEAMRESLMLSSSLLPRSSSFSSLDGIFLGKWGT